MALCPVPIRIADPLTGVLASISFPTLGTRRLDDCKRPLPKADEIRTDADRNVKDAAHIATYLALWSKKNAPI